MTDETARFTYDPRLRIYHPASVVAKALAKQRDKEFFDDSDLVEIKSRGFRVTLPNGQPIVTEVMA